MFKKLVRKIVAWSHTEHIDGDMPQVVSSSPNFGSTARREKSFGDGLTFTIHNATGGKLVQVTSYNSKTDRSNQSLYIIKDGDDLGDELSQIITREMLSR